MTMVPAPKLSKPHLIFYGGCGGGGSPEVMSRFGDGGGGSYGNINGGGNNNNNNVTNTGDNIMNKVDNSSNNDNNNNKVISSVLGSDLGIGRRQHHFSNSNNNNNNIGMADEEQRHQQHSRNSNNNSVNKEDGSGGDIRERSNSVKTTREDEDDVMDSSRWLQLGLGVGSGTHLISTSPQVESTPAARSGLMLELNLGGLHQMPELEPRIPRNDAIGFGGSTAPHHQHQFLLSQQQQQQQLGWGYVNQRTRANLSASSMSSSLHPQQQVLLPALQGGCIGFLTPSGSGSDSEFRVIHPPPRRPHSGIWFSLHPSPHQSKEPFLPQVSKNFLRIKDGRMTIRLVIKYVANKLGLDSESEVEIRCRGQQLLPYLTLQHVRDNIWSPREAAVTLLPDSSTSDHVMVLNYGRSTTSSAYIT